MKNIFERLAPFIQEYIYQNGWSEIRPIQVAACDMILNTEDNVLLSSGTASGKTEAAFLPILTDIYEKPSKTVSVLYISPIKALINDQFIRIEDMLKDTSIPVTKWHGDVSQTIKNKIIKNPKGIIQTTPESLEAIIMKNPGNIIKLFSDLRYIVIDEIHYFMNDDRGTQLLCILERIQRLIKKEPRRIGLSATLGDYELAKQWLSSGTKRICRLPNIKQEKRRIRLGIKYFRQENDDVINSEYHKQLYEKTLNKKCIVFSNSKSEVENNIAHLKTIAKQNNTKDVYHVHHANISSSLRKEVEEQMKQSDDMAVTGATVTLELGIDLGKIDRIIQTGSPYTVSSFVQRLGRSGRREKPAEMIFFFKDKEEFDFEFIKCIAIIELYLKEKWIEPIEKNTLPYSLLYHQTMSYLYGMGPISAKELAKQILTLTPFNQIKKEDYRILLKYLIEKEEIEKDEQGNLLIGINGEKKVNNYQFFSVFSTMTEYSVRDKSGEIGTVQIPYAIGQQFSLAGFNWKVIDVNQDKKYIFVKKVAGISKVCWNNEGEFFIHTKIIKKIKQILSENEEYKYLDNYSLQRLNELREIAKSTNILKDKIVIMEDKSYAIFPWLGTKDMFTLSYCLTYNKIENQIIYKAGMPIFIQVKSKITTKDLQEIVNRLKTDDINKHKLEIPDMIQKSGKYNYMIPKELLKKQFLEDCIDVKEMQNNL